MNNELFLEKFKKLYREYLNTDIELLDDSEIEANDLHFDLKGDLQTKPSRHLFINEFCDYLKESL